MTTYGLAQAQPRDVYAFVKQKHRRFGLERASFHFQPTLNGLRPPTANGVEVIFFDTDLFEELPLLDGSSLKYRNVKLSIAQFGADGPALAEAMKAEMTRLGYTAVVEEHSIDKATHMAEVGETAAEGTHYVDFVAAEHVTYRAGVPTVTGKKGPYYDAPKDDKFYSRQNGQWVEGSDISNAAGYFFQNSYYFTNGGTHDGSPDLVTDVDAGVETTIRFSNDAAGESGNYLQRDHQDHDHHGDTSLDHFYDRTTGIITLHHAKPDEFVLVRIAVDVEPDSDNSAADIVLRCTANGASGAFSFDIEEQLVSLDQGADTEYAAVASIPVFIGDTLSETPMGSPATIEPIIRFKNTSGDIKPRSLAFFIWS